MIREGERRALKAYFSGEPLEQVCRRFGYSRIRIKAMAEDYKSGKIDIFGPMDKKKFNKQFKEVDQLKARVAELEEALKMSKIKAEGGNSLAVSSPISSIRASLATRACSSCSRTERRRPSWTSRSRVRWERSRPSRRA